MSRNFLSVNGELFRGDYLVSNNGKWKAIFQDDGNFVVYSDKPTWASHTNGTDAVRVIMQSDCNLVMYTESNQPIWSTGTYLHGSYISRLQLTDDGNLLVYKDFEKLWNSADHK